MNRKHKNQHKIKQIFSALAASHHKSLSFCARVADPVDLSLAFMSPPPSKATVRTVENKMLDFIELFTFRTCLHNFLCAAVRLGLNSLFPIEVTRPRALSNSIRKKVEKKGIFTQSTMKILTFLWPPTSDICYNWKTQKIESDFDFNSSFSLPRLMSFSYHFMVINSSTERTHTSAIKSLSAAPTIVSKDFLLH